MSLKDHLSRDEDTDVKDVELLNVIRRSSKIAVGTAKVAEEVKMSDDGARGRLKQLEKEDKVEATPIGGGEKPNLAWSLATGVRSSPIPAELDRLGDQLHQLKTLGNYLAATGVAAVIAGAVLMLVSLTAAVQEVSLALVSGDALLVYALAGVTAGAAVLGIGLFVRVAAIGIENFATWYYLRE